MKNNYTTNEKGETRGVQNKPTTRLKRDANNLR